jgi:hypothetical protein
VKRLSDQVLLEGLAGEKTLVMWRRGGDSITAEHLRRLGGEGWSLVHGATEMRQGTYGTLYTFKKSR